MPRPRTASRAGLALAACALFLACALSLRSYLSARRLLGDRSRSPVSEAQAGVAFAQVPGLVNVQLQTSDGLTLNGWFAPGTRRATVVFVHGGGGNRLQLFPEARMLARHGYGILVYDSRASGNSSGTLDTWGDTERNDLAAALAYLRSRPDVDPTRIALTGFSIGASTVALAAAADKGVAAVILYATWTSLEDELKAKFGRFGPLTWGPALLAFRQAGVRLDAVQPLAQIASIQPRPLLFIAGSADADTPLPVMRKLFDAAGEPKELWIAPGVPHASAFFFHPVEYERRVTAFLARALADKQ